MFSKLSLAFVLLAVFIGVATPQEHGNFRPPSGFDDNPGQESRTGMGGSQQPGSLVISRVFRPGFRPNFGTGVRPGLSSGIRPGSGPGFHPIPGSGLRPGPGPGPGAGFHPGFGPGFRPGFGPKLRPGHGAAFRPGFRPGFHTGVGYRPCPCLPNEASSTVSSTSESMISSSSNPSTTPSMSSTLDSIISSSTDPSSEASDSSIQSSTSPISTEETTTLMTPILITTSDLSVGATTKVPDPNASTPGIEYYDYYDYLY